MERIKPVENVSKCIKTICPSPEELSIITNNVKCDKCGLVFKNGPRYRLHDLKVHQRKNLDKTIKENVQYHCPVESCIYALKAERHFSTMKYLKQVSVIIVKQCFFYEIDQCFNYDMKFNNLTYI